MQNTYLRLFSGLNFLFVIQFPKFLLHILQQTFKILNIVKKYFTLSLINNNPGECILRGQFQHIMHL